MGQRHNRQVSDMAREKHNFTKMLQHEFLNRAVGWNILFDVKQKLVYFPTQRPLLQQQQFHHSYSLLEHLPGGPS